MTLREVTRTVIDLVENMSGCPVAATEETSLKTLAGATHCARCDKPSALREREQIFSRLSNIEQSPSCVGRMVRFDGCAPMEDAEC